MFIMRTGCDHKEADDNLQADPYILDMLYQLHKNGLFNTKTCCVHISTFLL